ncbi:hypothetical protein [Streptomyces ehimensis]|uniref:Uncharacterized protein n=1 Tax=Streptomyces ehimensis TaxID=68195 RepID=A0ABV9BDP1_9ACTN
MPSMKAKAQMCSAPPMGMFFGASLTLVEPMRAEVLLPLYCGAVLAFVLGFVGRREYVRKGALEYERYGEQAKVEGGPGIYVQLVVSMTVAIGAGIWLSSAAW